MYTFPFHIVRIATGAIKETVYAESALEALRAYVEVSEVYTPSAYMAVRADADWAVWTGS
jgi:hypothetical protein